MTISVADGSGVATPLPFLKYRVLPGFSNSVVGMEKLLRLLYWQASL
jgi:hypothetical protein